MRFISGALCVLLTATTGSPVVAGPENAPKYAPAGTFGRVDLSGLKKKPKVINKKPIVIDTPALRARQKASGPVKPSYIFAPRVYYTGWERFCSRYDACAEPVYFIDHDWYYHAGPGRGMPYREGERRDHNHVH